MRTVKEALFAIQEAISSLDLSNEAYETNITLGSISSSLEELTDATQRIGNIIGDQPRVPGAFYIDGEVVNKDAIEAITSWGEIFLKSGGVVDSDGTYAPAKQTIANTTGIVAIARVLTDPPRFTQVPIIAWQVPNTHSCSAVTRPVFPWGTDLKPDSLDILGYLYPSGLVMNIYDEVTTQEALEVEPVVADVQIDATTEAARQERVERRRQAYSRIQAQIRSIASEMQAAK
jgi:hypothetical protein